MSRLSLSIALKEWSAVISALRDGRQMVLLRKGGIHETAGEFEIEHRRFVFFPTYLHQNSEMVKPAEQQRLDALSAQPAFVTIDTAAEITDIIQLRDRAQMDALDDQHIWAPPLIDMRFNYRPANPLYLLIVRAYRLASPRTLENTPAYAGCKSWVPLEETIAFDGATAALDDAAFGQKRQPIIERLKHRTGH